MAGRDRDEAVNAWAVVVAAGPGERLGLHTPKAFVELAGRSMIEWSMGAIEASSAVSGIVMVVPPSLVDWQPDGDSSGMRVVVGGGRTRQESVAAGIAEVPADVDVIVVHDAARPMAVPALFRGVVEALETTGGTGVVPVIASPDTVKRIAGGRVVETLSREEIGLAQTPQAFVASALRDAHAQAKARALDGTDDAMLLEACGYPVAVVEGDLENFKVTTSKDLERADDVLARRLGAGPEASHG